MPGPTPKEVVTVAPPESAPYVRPLTIHEAIIACMEDVRSIAKTSRHDSPTAKFNFRGIDDVVNSLGPAMRRAGIVPTPKVKSITFRDVKTSGGKDTRETTVLVRYRFEGPDGSHTDALVPGEAMDSGDKGSAKAMSVAYRIALLQVFALPTTDRKDPDHDVYERGAPAEQRTTPPVYDRAKNERAVVESPAPAGGEGHRSAAFGEFMKEITAATTADQVAQIGVKSLADADLTGTERAVLRTAASDRRKKLAADEAKPEAKS